jgi:hypothetical protein
MKNRDKFSIFCFIFMAFWAISPSAHAQNGNKPIDFDVRSIGKSTYNFKVKNAAGVTDYLRGKATSAGANAGFVVFWDMGDGAHYRGDNIKHTYKFGGKYTVRAFVGIYYSDREPHPMWSRTLDISGKSGKTGPSVISTFLLECSFDKDIKKSQNQEKRNVKKDEEFCLVAYIPNKGELKLNYNASDFSILGQITKNGEAGELKNNALSVEAGQKVFIPLKANKNMTGDGQLTQFSATLNGQTQTIDFIKNTAHDPNDMQVERSQILFREFEGKVEIPIKYRVRFENMGRAPAQNVRVAVSVPKGMTFRREEGVIAYDYGRDIGIPQLQSDFPLCQNDAQKGCLDVSYLSDAKNKDSLVFVFRDIQLKGMSSVTKDDPCSDKMRHGSITYYLHAQKPHKNYISEAFIGFDNAITPTNSERVRLKKQLRVSLRLAADMLLPKDWKDFKSGENYEIGLVVSRLYPFGFYFPTELGVSFNEQEWKDGTNLVKGRPIRVSQQIRRNTRGGFFGMGVGLSANVALNVKRGLNSDFADYTDLQLFGDVNINAQKQRPTLGLRFGYPLNKKFEPRDGGLWQLQLYGAWQFK